MTTSITGPVIAAYVERNKRRFRNRRKTVGASEIGGCTRRVWFDKNQKNGDAHVSRDDDYEDTWGAAARGRNFESTIWVPAMKARYGANLLFAGTRQKRFVSGNLSATPDALVIKQPRDCLADLMVPDIGPSQCFVIDCKTIDPRINLSEPKPEHTFQLQVQLGLMRELTQFKPEYGVISYTNASFFDDNVDFVVRFSEKIFAHARVRADRIMTASDARQMKPEGWIAGGKECSFCPWEKTCRAMRGDVPEEVKELTPQQISMFKDMAREERRLDAISSAAEAKKRDMQNTIKEALKEVGTKRVDVPDDVRIVWSHVVGRPAYDMPGIKKAAEEAGIDLSKFERVGTPSDRLTISIVDRDRLKK